MWFFSDFLITGVESKIIPARFWVVIQWSSNSGAQASLSLVWIKQREHLKFLLSVAVHAAGRCRKPGCGLAEEMLTNVTCHSPGGHFQAISTANYGPHTPGDRNDCISSSMLPRELLAHPTCFLELKKVWTFVSLRHLTDTGTTQLDSFALQLSFLVHGQLFSNRYSCFNPKRISQSLDHKDWNIIQ